ncbi:hypothetical protein HWV62_11093 [Athelia sp. TMB]|nr:hypothetical protein HWV62_11093 [Athelia sp. TMB]
MPTPSTITVTTAVVEWILLLRVWAIYRPKRYIRFIALFFYFGGISSLVALTITDYVADTVTVVEDFAVMPGCYAASVPGIIAGYWIAPVLVESLFFGLIIVRLMTWWKDRRSVPPTLILLASRMLLNLRALADPNGTVNDKSKLTELRFAPNPRIFREQRRDHPEFEAGASTSTRPGMSFDSGAWEMESVGINVAELSGRSQGKPVRNSPRYLLPRWVDSPTELLAPSTGLSLCVLERRNGVEFYTTRVGLVLEFSRWKVYLARADAHLLSVKFVEGRGEETRGPLHPKGDHFFLTSIMSIAPGATSPTEQELVDAILAVQRSHGLEIGITKIQEHIKSTHADWALAEKRLRAVRAKYELAEFTSDTQSASAPSSIVLGSGAALAPGANLTKFHLDYLLTGDGAVVRFIEAIPTAYCVPEPPQEASRYLSILTNAHDEEVLRRWNSVCPWCSRPAQAMYSAMAMLLHGALTTPMVLVTALPLCSSSGKRSGLKRHTYFHRVLHSSLQQTFTCITHLLALILQLLLRAQYLSENTMSLLRPVLTSTRFILPRLVSSSRTRLPLLATSSITSHRTYASKSKDKGKAKSTATLVPGSQQKLTDPAAIEEYGKAEQKMTAAVAWYAKEVAQLETRASGRVTPALLAPVRVTLEGAPFRLEDVATVGVREGSTLIVTVFEENSMKHVEKALYDAKLPGIAPQRQDSRTIKIPIPKPTVEARTALATTAQRLAEDTRMQLRKAQGASTKKGKYEKHSIELEEFQKLTDAKIAEVDKILAATKKAMAGR